MFSQVKIIWFIQGIPVVSGRSEQTTDFPANAVELKPDSSSKMKEAEMKERVRCQQYLDFRRITDG